MLIPWERSRGIFLGIRRISGFLSEGAENIQETCSAQASVSINRNIFPPRSSAPVEASTWDQLWDFNIYLKTLQGDDKV